MKTAKYLSFAVIAAIVSFWGIILLWFILYMMMGEPQSDGFFAALILCSIVVPILVAIWTYKRFKNKDNDPTLEIKTNLKEAKKKENKRELSGRLQLIGGLSDLPQGSICKVFYNQNRIRFIASGQEFTLEANKMIDVSVMTPTEIQKQYISSVGGAIAGAVLLGPIGAIIGGSASKKTIRKTNRYLVISYRSDEEIKYIIFDVSTEMLLGNSIKNTYKNLKKNENIRVEL